MRNLGPTAEITAIRAEIARLEARAETLRALLRTIAEPHSTARPGWPIRREPEGERPRH
jgi:hypothetical protein